MPATFNPATSYAEEWRYLDGIDDAVVYEIDPEGRETGTSWAMKVQRSSVAESYLAQAAVQNGINPSDTVFAAWKSSLIDPPPKSGHALQVGATRWIVQRVFERRWGPVYDLVVGAPLDRNRFNSF